MRYGLKHLLLFTALVAILSLLWSLDWNHSHVATVDCGQGRRIHIYEDFFCDFATIPVYEVEIDGRIVVPKYSTFLWFECGNPILADNFEIQYDESNDGLIAITYDDDIALIHNFDTGTGWPSANYGRDVPTEINARLELPEPNRKH